MESSVELNPDPLIENGLYEKMELLGKGSFGFVVLARNTDTQEVVAIKLLPRTEVSKYVEAELVNHSLLRHPHVIQFKEVFLTHKYICIVMEYATGGTLFQYVQTQGRLREAVARWFFQQLVVGVDYCHRRGVANRDIKLENTLLQKVARLPLPLLKICDFGYSKAENKSAAKSKVGTLTYMAPEVLININRDGKYSGKVADIWSCGVMLYVMLCGRYPFDSPNVSGVIAIPNDFICMLERMVGRQYKIPPDAHISSECLDLLSRMLLPEPHKRITVKGIMEHPWFVTNLPPDAGSMNETYLNAPPPAGKLPPEGIRRLLEEAHLGSRQCRIDTRLSPRQQAAAVMQLVEEHQLSKQQQQLILQQQLQLLRSQQQLNQHQQQQQQQVRLADGSKACAQFPALLQQHQQHLLQQLQAKQEQQQVAAPATAAQQLQLRPQLMQPPAQQQQQWHSRQVDADTLMMIDHVISDQFKLRSAGASQELQAFIKTAQPAHVTAASGVAA